METFEELVQVKVGEASMCWSEAPRGVFESDQASAIALDIINAHESSQKKVSDVIKELEQQLKDAEKVVRFYASYNNWGNVNQSTKSRVSINDCSPKRKVKCKIRYGGKTAREYITKYKQGKEQR